MAGPEKIKEAAKSDPMSPTDLARFVSDSLKQVLVRVVFNAPSRLAKY